MTQDKRLKITITIALIILYSWCINRFGIYSGTIGYTILIVSALTVNLFQYKTKSQNPLIDQTIMLIAIFGTTIPLIYYPNWYLFSIQIFVILGTIAGIELYNKRTMVD